MLGRHTKAYKLNSLAGDECSSSTESKPDIWFRILCSLGLLVGSLVTSKSGWKISGQVSNNTSETYCPETLGKWKHHCSL